jgi:hypothetical protein
MNQVEKDKCLMSEWISQAGLPQERVVGPWRELPATIAVLREIADGKMPKGEAPLQYPIFLKACHITQGIQHGTTMVASQAAFKEKWDKYAPTHPLTYLLLAKQRSVVCVCVCVLSHWVHTAIGEGSDLPALKCLPHRSLGLYLASVDSEAWFLTACPSVHAHTTTFTTVFTHEARI